MSSITTQISTITILEREVSACFKLRWSGVRWQLVSGAIMLGVAAVVASDNPMILLLIGASGCVMAASMLKTVVMPNGVSTTERLVDFEEIELVTSEEVELADGFGEMYGSAEYEINEFGSAGPGVPLRSLSLRGSNRY